jgi:hypothetical protein
MRPLEKSSRFVAIAKHRLVNGGPESCKRIEHEAILAMEMAEWNRAKKLLHLRLDMRLVPTSDERRTLDRVLGLIDEAEAKGIGPGPLLPRNPTCA